MKIAVVTPIPTPYRDPFWNVVAATKGVDLSVYYCATGKGDRPWSGKWKRSYSWEVLSGRNLLAWKGSDASVYYNPLMVQRLRDGHFDFVLIGGYNHLTMLLAIRYCIRRGIPYFLMCESHLAMRRSRLRSMIKDKLVRWVVGHMAGGFPTGKLAECYLLHYGARSTTLTYLPNAPHIEKIRAQAQDLRGNRTELRSYLGFSERPTMLFVGRLIPKKGAHLIINALDKVQEGLSLDLVIVGDGPELGRLAQLTAQLELKDSVRFVGFVEPADMVKWYTAADIFVLPSAETWGVVVSEALAAGLPVIVSDQVGCHPDIIGDLPVGKVVRREDIASWALAITELIQGDISAESIDQNWSEVYERMRYSAIAAAMFSNVHVVGDAEQERGEQAAQ